MDLNRLFRSKIVAVFHRNCRNDSNWDIDFGSKFNSYQNLVKFIRNWSKMNGFCHFRHSFRYKLTFNWLLRSFNWLFWSFNQNFWSFYWSFNRIRSNLDRKRSILYWNHNPRFGFVIGFWIRPKSTIEFGHGFRFDDYDSIRYP